jgi:hypothetical protein
MDKQEKEILVDYVESLNESLEYWTKNAGKFYMGISAGTNVIPFELQTVVKLINSRLDSFRSELKIQYEYYQELEKGYGLKPLSFTYLNEFAVITQELKSNLEKVKEIADKYETILGKTESYGIDINKYIGHKNRKAIERLKDIDVEDLLNILSDNDLLGF